jgi:hypothetical protein
VDTGSWIFGSRVVLSAGTISRVDRTARRVCVYPGSDEIKNAPVFDTDTYRDAAHGDRLGTYYGRFGYSRSRR